MNADVTIEAGVVYKDSCEANKEPYEANKEPCEARDESCESTDISEPHEAGEEPRTNAERFLQDVFHVSPVEKPMGIHGILHTRDYDTFEIYSDTGSLLHTFTGATRASRCLPGDHVSWDDQCHLELRDEHPPLVGTVELTNPVTYGRTSKHVPLYLFTPYDKRYPHFIVGCSEKNKKENRIAIITFHEWADHATFPRGHLQTMLGVTGNDQAERKALIHQACPWTYPVYKYAPEQKGDTTRRTLTGHTFHVDPEGCKDVDDVITVEPLGDQWRITITISDVAAYVEDGSAVDIMASLISQTLYHEGVVQRPMLPSAYSEKTCSLLPGKESYGVSFQFVWTGSEIVDGSWFESVFHVDESYTYDEFQASPTPYPALLADITSFLAKETLSDAHQWIEQLMILYNKEAGRILKKRGEGILRTHAAPDGERLAMYAAHVPDLMALAYSSASYVLAEEAHTFHYGLETDAYAHASSPIRRYADLVNQRVLKQWIRGSAETYIVPVTMYDLNRRGKEVKQFERDMAFLEALETGETVFSAILMEVQPLTNQTVKVRFYVPSWKRMISSTYRPSSPGYVWSRDETVEMDVTLYRHVTIRCSFLMAQRNWKERVVLEIL
jgi:exoribonuclease R